MGYCCVPSCRSTQSKGISFHKFPICIESKRKWIIAITQKGNPGGCHWTATGRSTICSRHFKDTDFSISTTKKILLPTAVPSVFEDLVSQKRARRKKSKRVIGERKKEVLKKFRDYRRSKRYTVSSVAEENSENEDDPSYEEDADDDVPSDFENSISINKNRPNESHSSRDPVDLLPAGKEMSEVDLPAIEGEKETSKNIDSHQEEIKSDSESMIIDDVSDCGSVLSDERLDVGSDRERSVSPVEYIPSSTTIKISKNLQSVLRKLVTTIENQRAEISRLKMERDNLNKQVMNLIR